ncbi:uncharacterized protein LOC126324536 [Schistocerca gregaria]|uniref:uncharacterized protein LOC126324536 n=1 Tax=Schistocerca gregaria TaxID=7010 RepID=UPI00211EFFE7|nr:uncharacterized protein LOC126324536 [Schistocerca gregaria]
MLPCARSSRHVFRKKKHTLCLKSRLQYFNFPVSSEILWTSNLKLHQLFISHHLQSQNSSFSSCRNLLSGESQKIQTSDIPCVEQNQKVLGCSEEGSYVANEYDFVRTKDQKDHGLTSLKVREHLNSILNTQEKNWIMRLAIKLFFRSVSYNVVGQFLYSISKYQSERVEWLQFGIPRSFASWFSVSIIHVWMILVRIRKIEDEQISRALAQRVIDAFFLDIERGIVRKTHVTNPIILGKSNKQFLRSYYGSMTAYDETLVNGDPTLADALYRNLYGLDISSASCQEIEGLVQYIRRTLHKLDNLSNETFLSGNWCWNEPPSPSSPLSSL